MKKPKLKGVDAAWCARAGVPNTPQGGGYAIREWCKVCGHPIVNGFAVLRPDGGFDPYCQVCYLVEYDSK